jgi:hypothetical protein
LLVYARARARRLKKSKCVEYKTALRERLIRLCRDAKLTDPERLADEVFLLCEGARITAQSVGFEGPSSRLAGMLEALVADHCPTRQAGEFARPCHAQPSAELTPKTCAGFSCSTGVPGSRRASRLRPYHAMRGMR